MKEITRNIITISIATAITILFLCGCTGPLYTKEAQYTAGKGWGLFGSGTAARAKIDRLAVAKLQATPVQVEVTNGASLGYLGVISNNSNHRRLLFKYAGPETGSEYLGPGQQVEKYLLPGTYSGEIFYGGQKVGWTTFKSEPVNKTYLGKTVHWFFFSEW